MPFCGSAVFAAGFFFGVGAGDSSTRLVGLDAAYRLAEGVHEVDDLATSGGGSFVLGDGRVFDLGFDEFFQRDLVAIDELGRIEFGGFALDEFLGEAEGVLVDLGFLDVAEVLFWGRGVPGRSAWCRPSCRRGSRPAWG